MVTFARTLPVAPTDGVYYAKGATVPAAEGDVYNGPGELFDPTPVQYNQSLVAAIGLTAVGTLLTNSTYVIIQGDLGDGVWFDLAWVSWTGLTGTASFMASVGSFTGNALQQTRTIGTAPSPSLGGVQVPLPGRIRVVGKATVTGTPGGSSPGPQVGPAVQVTVLLKFLGLR